MASYSDTKKGILHVPRWRDCKINKTKQIPQHGITEPRLTGLGYDSCAYKLDNMESMSPGMYHMNDRTHYDSCFMGHPGYLANSEGKGVLSNKIDVESELKSLNYINSKCPETRYNPILNCKKCKKCNTGIPCGCPHCKKDPHGYKKPNCAPEFVPEYTREPKSCNDITSLNINRFTPLCLDVQRKNRIHSNDYIGRLTRQDTKDVTRYIRKNMPKAEFEEHCDCTKIIGKHSALDCLYKKDAKKHRILPNYWQ